MYNNMQQELGEGNILPQKWIDEYEAYLRKLENQPIPEQVNVYVIDKSIEIVIKQDTTMKTVIRTLRANQFKAEDRLVLMDGDKQVDMDQIGDHLAREIDFKNFVLTSERHEIKKILEKLIDPLKKKRTFEIVDQRFKQKLDSFKKQGETTEQFMRQFQNYLEGEFSSKMESSEKSEKYENKGLDLSKDLREQEKALLMAVENLNYSKYGQSRLLKSTADVSVNDQSINKSNRSQIGQQIYSSQQKKLYHSQGSTNVTKGEDKPQLHKAKYVSIHKALENQIKDYELVQKLQRIEWNIKSKFMIRKCENKQSKIMAFNEILSEFKNVEKNKSNSNRFVLYFLTQSHCFLAYSQTGIDEKNFKLKSQQMKKEEFGIEEKQQKENSKFLMIYSLKDKSYKIYKCDNKSKIIALDSNQFEIFGLLKVSFEKGMYFTPIDSSGKYNDLMQLIKSPNNSQKWNQISLIQYWRIGLEYCRVSSKNKEGFGFEQMSKVFKQLLQFSQIDPKVFKKQQQIRELCLKIEARNNRTKQFIILLRKLIENPSEENKNKIKQIKKYLRPVEKNLLQVFEEKLLKFVGKSLIKSEMETTAETKYSKQIEASANTSKKEEKLSGSEGIFLKSEEKGAQSFIKAASKSE